jgi:transcription elongation factor GreA
MSAQHLSRAAFDRLAAELEDLTTRGRIEVANKIEAARLLGDLSENGDYHAAKDEQGHMEGRIRQLEYLLDQAVIVEAAGDGSIGLGSVVKVLFDGDPESEAQTYLIGHIEEQHPEYEVMSDKSPLGAALLGAKTGDDVTYAAPTGAQLKVKVLSVETAS